MENEEKVTSRTERNKVERRGDISAPIWVLVIGILVLGAIALWVFKPQAVPVTQPEEIRCEEAVGTLPTNADANAYASADGRQVFTEEIEGEYSLTVVEYVDGWDSYGKMVREGTKVTGPALIKPNPNTAHGIGILVGAEYVLKNDSVVWLLRANDEGVRSQSMFFSSWEEITPERSK